ncbi:MAG: metallophosphoesterase [Verrucomicrobia bacterium]|nr:metallophosphoesterase [Verrucomicrobiota bacterium]
MPKFSAKLCRRFMFVLGAACLWPATKSFAVDYNILLGRPTDKSIAVSLLASNDLQIYFELGSQSGSYTNQTATMAVTNGIPSVTTFAGLQPNQKYFYRVRYSTNGVAPFSAGGEASFRTQRARGSTFVFAIEADPHNRDNDPGVWELCLTNMLADAPDFLFDLGDTFMEEKLANTNAYWLTQPGIIELHKEVRNLRFGLVGHSLPLFLVDGNHEAEVGWRVTNTSSSAVWGAQARQYYFPVPVPAAGGFYSGAMNNDPFMLTPRDAYYAFEWGDALFVSLDPFWFTTPKPGNDGWGWTLGTNQYYWLKQTLENSTAKFKFVFAHHLVGGLGGAVARGGLSFASWYEWGGYNTNGTYGFTSQRPGWPAPIQDLLLTKNVQVFFHGHDHLFVKEDFRLPGNSNGAPNLIYQDVPQPSRLPGNTNSAVGYGYTNAGQVLIASSGHLRVTVSPTNALVEYVRVYLPSSESAGKINRMVAYSYNIPAPTNPPPVLAGTMLNNRRIQLSIAGTPGQACTVQASTNLINWTNVFSTNVTAALVFWSDGESTNFPSRFYRVLGSQ